ncbi:hypothetical protein [Streptomyces sp. or3]|uniref:hypothetical protein n=1 Tax=Streptomyces sp. or3 TaxID=1828020 RepID=UPI000BFB91A8|nr:hypothetical protein [Streptomyces sp. or3]
MADEEWSPGTVPTGWASPLMHAPHTGFCDHGPCTITDLIAVERLDDPRCCAGHHPEAAAWLPR